METLNETTPDITPWSLPDRLRLHRARSGLTQREVAARAGVKRHRYADFERGHVRPTTSEIHRVAPVLGVKASFLTRGSDWSPPGPDVRRPACTLRDRRAWRPKQDSPTAIHVKAALETWPDWALKFLTKIGKRKDLPLVRRFLREVACDSKLEAMLLLALLAHGARPVWDSPLVAGFREWPIVLRGRQAGDCRHPGLEFEFLGIRFVLFFQVSLQLRGGRIRVDGLVAVREFGGRTRWAVAEVDGPDHVDEKDRMRRLRHGLPEVRIGYQQFGSTDPAVLLVRRVLDRLQIEASPEKAESLRRRRSRKRAADLPTAVA